MKRGAFQEAALLKAGLQDVLSLEVGFRVVALLKAGLQEVLFLEAERQHS